MATQSVQGSYWPAALPALIFSSLNRVCPRRALRQALALLSVDFRTSIS
jgi:hypothetical protein